MEGGAVKEHSGKSAIENTIWSGIHRKIFYLGKQAPICKGLMKNAFWYLATTITAQQILEGTYRYPEWLDESTKELCQMCAEICLGVPLFLVVTTICHQ